MTPDGDTVDAKSARELLASNEATVIDIRDDEAWKNGHVPGARHHASEEIEDSLEEVDSGQKVIIVCEDGEDSAGVADRLGGEGKREFLSLEGGMEAWRSGDMPMQPSRDPDDDVPI